MPSTKGIEMKISELKVLICDDSILVRKQLTEILQMMGITAIFEAKDGIQAIETYKEHKPDVTFMDIVMPKKTGVEALEEIKAYDADAKVVMASTIGTQNYLLNAIKAGATDFLQKPVKDEDVYRVLHNIVKGWN
jgi:two-component system chemotaxis response regulator CheY